MGFWNGVVSVLGAIPVIGTVTAGVQYIAGDKENAQKSLATSTGNLVGALGAIGGFAVGGPPGAVAGAAACSAIGGQIERKINGQDLDLSLSKLGIDALAGGASMVVSGSGGTLVSVGKSIGVQIIGQQVAEL